MATSKRTSTPSSTTEKADEPRSVTKEQEPIVGFTRGPDGNVVPIDKEES